MRGDQHVYPVADLVDHDTENRSCWCRPRVAAPCDECADGCWKCDGGFIDVGRGHGANVVVIHNAADGRA